MKKKNFIKKFFKNEHVRSFIHTFVTELLWGPIGGAFGAWLGSFSGDSLITGGSGAIGYALFRTAARVILKELQKAFPKEE